MLWERTAILQRPGIYAFVALDAIKDQTSWAVSISGENTSLKRDESKDGEWICSSEIFYVGISRKSLRARIGQYHSHALKAVPRTIEHNDLKKAQRHRATWALKLAYMQRARVDLYVRYLFQEYIYFENMPVDLLAGIEMGLMRELDPKANRQFR